MIEFFQKRFALSLEGAKDLKTAIFVRAFLNITFLFPVIVTFIFLDDWVKVLLESSEPKYGLVFYIILSFVFFLVMLIVSYIDYEKTYTKIYNESANTRIKLAETLRKLPLSFFAKKEATDLSSTIMEDTTMIETLFSHSVPQIFGAIISMSVMVVSLFFYDVIMSISMFWVVPVGFFLFYLSKKIMARDHERIYKIKRDISTDIQDGLEMMGEIKAYGLENDYLKKLDEKLDFYEKNLIKGELIGGGLINASHFILKLGLPSVVLTGAYLFLNGDISIFKYMVFLIIVSRVYDPFIEALNHFAALLVLDVRLQRAKDMQNLPLQDGDKSFEPENFDIEFKNVDFSYKKELQTLKNISFTAKQGEITALIGESGGGKTTVAKLCARFWDIQEGTIFIGKKDISKIDPESLLKHFSIVFQDVTLFNTSVLENIRLGRKNATDEEVKEVAKLAQCEEFIEKLPNGYETQIGENGEKLSGGERQRISIARALLKNAPIILLDEATASLDARNETKIQKAISELVKDKTVIIIAHRMRTIINADKIISIKNGQIVESGTPQELIKKDGVFANMMKMQTQ